jgi:isoquinoline 1-oxidoreductase
VVASDARHNALIVRLTVNGRPCKVSSRHRETLLTALREQLHLTGAKYGCGEGACGVCTVLLDGDPVRACMVAVSEVADRSVTTIEGLSHGAELHPVQRAFVECCAMQCGYCTPGMILSAAALLRSTADPDEGQIKAAMDGNVCRCGAYPRILRAVRRASELIRTKESPLVSVGWEDTVIPPANAEGRRPWDLVSLAKRDYFDALSDGLVVVLPPESTSSWSAGGGAWLHVGATDVVTAFTGKVDVGQDNRTTLSMLVAEELAAPLDRVRLVMGDTDICPFDIGTFGSRSTPDAGSALRKTAAAARRALIAMAARRWRISARSLRAADGAVRSRDGRRSISYGQLLTGIRKVELASWRSRPTAAARWRVAGRPVIRVDAVEIVTGRQRYPSDLSRPGMLYGKVLRPPAFGARLRSVDMTRAQRLKGAIVIHEGSFVGTAAPDLHTAQRALDLIEPDWELDPQPSERDLETFLRGHPVDAQGWESGFDDKNGDPEGALRSAPVRLDATYTTAYIAHTPMETRAVLAEWEGKRLTVSAGTQQPFMVREHTAQELRMSEKSVRVVVPLTGGGFGGKHAGEVAVEAARLARASGRPVKLRWTREEEFTWGYFRPAAVIDVRSGAKRDGTMTAWEFRNINSGSAAIDTPYEVPNRRMVFQPAASPLAQGPYRALAATANTFARESHMDELAHRLDLDPLDFRLANLRDERLAAVVNAAAEKAGWRQRRRGAGHGTGIACSIEKDSRVATCVEVVAGAHRRLEIRRIVTAFECGAIVNPVNLTNQIEGAMVMGLGGALFEAVHFEDGRILNASLSKYRVPRFQDTPAIEVVLIDRPDIPSAGAGETPIVALAPAIANAIYEATGQRLRSLPLLADGLLP